MHPTVHEPDRARDSPKVLKQATEALSFRSLRHHSTARLYEIGDLDEVLSEALFTSTAQLNKTYSQLYPTEGGADRKSIRASQKQIQTLSLKGLDD